MHDHSDHPLDCGCGAHGDAGDTPVAEAPNTLYDALFRPHIDTARPFLHWQGRPIGYARFLRLAARIANALRAAGLGPGDRVAVQVGKSPTALALYAGAVQAGIVYLPLNTAYTPAEVGYFVADSGARLLICAPQAEEALHGADEAPPILTLSDDGTSGRFHDLLSGQPDVAEVAARGPGDLAALLYTSGTTGRSKGAMLTHDNLLSICGGGRSVAFHPGRDTLLHALLIISHPRAVRGHQLVTLLAGGAAAAERQFDAARAIGLDAAGHCHDGRADPSIPGL